jgi:hypothetical protein
MEIMAVIVGLRELSNDFILSLTLAFNLRKSFTYENYYCDDHDYDDDDLNYRAGIDSCYAKCGKN